MVPLFSQFTDNQLVDAARVDEDDAWAELLRRYHGPLLRFLTAATGDPEVAADLAQETFLDAFRALDRLAPDAPFAAWLYRIARNNLLPFWRHQNRLRVVSLEVLTEGEAALPSLVRLDDFADAAVEGDTLRRVLDELSPLLREALLLHSIKGLSTREVATVLGIAPRTAEQRITRAKIRFRARYVELAREGET